MFEREHAPKCVVRSSCRPRGLTRGTYNSRELAIPISCERGPSSLFRFNNENLIKNLLRATKVACGWPIPVGPWCGTCAGAVQSLVQRPLVVAEIGGVNDGQLATSKQNAVAFSHLCAVGQGVCSGPSPNLSAVQQITRDERSQCPFSPFALMGCNGEVVSRQGVVQRWKKLDANQRMRRAPVRTQSLSQTMRLKFLCTMFVVVGHRCDAKNMRNMNEHAPNPKIQDSHTGNRTLPTIIRRSAPLHLPPVPALP